MISSQSIATRPISSAWEAKTLSELFDELPLLPWAVVEFWAEDCLFTRLIAPTRRVLRDRYHHCCPLLRCRVRGDESACVDFGVSALPAIILFAGGCWKKRWIAETHPCLITWALDPIFGYAGARGKRHDA